MQHVICYGTTLRVFNDGVSSTEYPAARNIPPGHYKATIRDNELLLTNLSPKSVSWHAVNGRKLGIRARWDGDEVSISGRVLPIGTLPGPVVFDNPDGAILDGALVSVLKT